MSTVLGNAKILEVEPMSMLPMLGFLVTTSSSWVEPEMCDLMFAMLSLIGFGEVYSVLGLSLPPSASIVITLDS